jgi:mRNA interferase MazF
VAKVYPSEAQVMFNGRPGKALADQLTTVSKLRLLDLGGKLTDAEMRDVERAIRIQLALL